jgi:plasmid stabilization system protein ParE
VYSLSEQAEADLNRIIDELLSDSEHGGKASADRVFGILHGCMLRIASGLTKGHRRKDVKPRRPLLFAVARPSKYVIAFDPRTREIARIIHGSRNFPSIFKST